MVQQLTYTRAIEVIASSYCNIPNPSLLIVSGTTTSSGSDQLICSSGLNFTALGIQIGDIVYIPGDNLGATVAAIINSDTLLLNTSGVTTSSGVAFYIYAGEQNDASKSGCVLFGLNASDSICICNAYVLSLCISNSSC